MMGPKWSASASWIRTEYAAEAARADRAGADFGAAPVVTVVAPTGFFRPTGRTWSLPST